MKDLNKVQIIGRLGADPELRFTPGGTPVATFRVAAGRQWMDGNGALHEETEWFRVVAWNSLAERCHQFLSKGARVYVEGRLQTRKWQDQDGQDRYTAEVIANDMIMLDARRSAPATNDDALTEDEPISPAEVPPVQPEPAVAPARARVRNSSGGRVVAPASRSRAVPEEELPI